MRAESTGHESDDLPAHAHEHDPAKGLSVEDSQAKVCDGQEAE
jgi:hypothetical protein